MNCNQNERQGSGWIRNLLLVAVGLWPILQVPSASSIQTQDVPEPSNVQSPNDSESVVRKIEAVSRLSRSAGSATEYSSIIEQCDQILESQPEKTEHVGYLQSLKAWALNRRAQTRMELAERFEKIGNHDQANQVLESAREDLDISITANSDKWKARQNRAILLTRLEQYQAAIDDWTQVIALRPDSSEANSAIFNRAELFYETDQYEQALADYREALKMKPDDRQSLNGCGNSLLALGRAEEAIEFYDRIMQSEPGNAGALVNRGDARQQLQQWAAALNDYRASNATAPSGRTLQRMAWLLATCPDQEICDAEAALSSIREAIALDGESAENLDTLAAAHAAAGQFDQARDVQTRAIALSDSAAEEGFQVRQTMYENNEPFRQSDDPDKK